EGTRITFEKCGDEHVEKFQIEVEVAQTQTNNSQDKLDQQQNQKKKNEIIQLQYLIPPADVVFIVKCKVNRYYERKGFDLHLYLGDWKQWKDNEYISDGNILIPSLDYDESKEYDNDDNDDNEREIINEGEDNKDGKKQKYPQTQLIPLNECFLFTKDYWRERDKERIHDHHKAEKDKKDNQKPINEDIISIDDIRRRSKKQAIQKEHDRGLGIIMSQFDRKMDKDRINNMLTPECVILIPCSGMPNYKAQGLFGDLIIHIDKNKQ
ncbi:MAG: hypothetical protein EZS28_006027, partial [Streblomastix strix]